MGTTWQLLKTIGLVLQYYVFSISLTFYNKKLLRDYPFPICMTIMHLLEKFVLALIVRRIIFGCVCKTSPPSLNWKEYIKSICPVGIFSALDIGLSNWSLVYITVSLYTMSKSTAIIFILFFALILKLEQPRILQIAVVFLIFGGLIMFTYESTSFEWEGFILVISASVVTGLRWSTAQLAIQKEELGFSNPVNIIYNLQPVMILTLIPLAFFIDGIHMGTSRKIFLAPNATSIITTLLLIMAAGLLAFLLAMSEYLLVYHTSGLTLSISGVLKEIIILILSTVLIEESGLTLLKIAGMIVCILGVATHSVLKIIKIQDEGGGGGKSSIGSKEQDGSISKLLATASDKRGLLNESEEGSDEEGKGSENEESDSDEGYIIFDQKSTKL